MTIKEKEKMIALLDRTYYNCLFYKENNNSYSLANEIGVLRGIAYCLSEIAGICPHNEDFLEMIEIQQKLKSRDLKGDD